MHVDEGFFAQLHVEADGTFSQKRPEHRQANAILVKRPGKRRGVPNKTETWYQDHVLIPAAHDHQIVAWAYCETIGLSFPLSDAEKSPVYTPDFLVIVREPVHFLQIELHEVKARRGKWSSAREAAILRLKLAKIRYPQFIWKRIDIEQKQCHVKII